MVVTGVPLADSDQLTMSEPMAPRGDAADIVSQPQSMPAGVPQAPEVEDPWRDFSGDRQVVTTKELEMEVGDVERAYDDVRSIVEKQGGFIATDRVQISEEQADTAHLTIRLPVEHFETAIAQIRQLGEVTRLVGQSVDVTVEYHERGADIREMSREEQRLVDEIAAEPNAAKKRELKAPVSYTHLTLPTN